MNDLAVVLFVDRYSLDAHQNGGLHLANAGDNEWALPWSGLPAPEFPDVIDSDRLQRQGLHASANQVFSGKLPRRSS